MNEVKDLKEQIKNLKEYIARLEETVEELTKVSELDLEEVYSNALS